MHKIEVVIISIVVMIIIIIIIPNWEQLPEALGYNSKGRGFDSRLYHWNFTKTWSFRLHCGPGVDLDSNINEYREYFLGVKVACAWGWQLYKLHVPIS